MDLSRNRLSGLLPMEVGTLINLGALDVSENMLSGEIPGTLDSCVRLEFLHMKGNSFQGSVPSSLSSLRGLQELDLSRNNLSGTIPEYLADFQLQLLNLSFNNFEGELPIKGIFKNATATLVMGNNKLCGGVPELKLPKCNFKRLTKSRSTFWLRLLIPLSCGLLGLIFILCLLYLCQIKQSKKETTSSLLESSLLKVSYQSLLKATEGFSLDNLIGVGSFGSVYKGVLDQNGTIVAVKVLNLSSRGASKSFLAECEALRNIWHRNLLKVLTSCSGADYQGNDFKAIVYEFMVNGNLDEWLHPILREHQENEEPRFLCLLQRSNIAIDVAYALEYLHHHCQTPIIHCDLKPSNILLDDEMTAHVGDFGLAQFGWNASDHNDSHQASSSIGLRGSIGYTAPEYGIGSEVSTYGDVYSYGILMLQMFTGRRPTDEMFNNTLTLHNYVKRALLENAEHIADPMLLQPEEEGETSTNPRSRDQRLARSPKIQEALISLFKIGLACSQETPNKRLAFGEILAKLQVIRDKITATGGRQRGRTALEIQS